MAYLNLQASYFSFENPPRLLDRWLNRLCHQQLVSINQHEVAIKWTNRAELALSQRHSPLIVELQLYFSCMVKKRVLFHQNVGFETPRVNDRVQIAFRPITSAACNPEELATNYPEDMSLSKSPAGNMIPRVVEIDFRNGNWEGRYNF